MRESQKNKPEAELCDETLNTVSGGAANGTFWCEECRKYLPLSEQSKYDSRYCEYCYHYSVQYEQNLDGPGRGHIRPWETD